MFRRPKPPSYNRFYFGQHKCASVWCRNIVRQLAKKTRLPLEPVQNLAEFKALELGNDHWVTCPNATQHYVDHLEHAGVATFRAFHVIRDPRDIAVSAYFSHLKVHNENEFVASVRQRLQELPLQQGLRLTIDGREEQFRAMQQWRSDDPRTLEVRFEELTTRPKEQWQRIADHLELGLSPADLEPIIDRFAFENLTGGRARGEEDTSSHFRKGVAGDWKNYFDPETTRHFKDRYGQLLVDLGYERDLNW
jgi:hypothetical protein